MAASSFPTVALQFNWLNNGPEHTPDNNTDHYRGSILLRGTPANLPVTTALQDAATLATLRRAISIRPIPGSSGGTFYVDWNGTVDPSGTLTLSDGSTVTAVLTEFRRTRWLRNSVIEADVEFVRVV